MAHHDVENNPKKEVFTALIGIVLLLAIIGGIAVFGWLRPAGVHQPKETPAVQDVAQAADGGQAENADKQAADSQAQDGDSASEQATEAPKEANQDTPADGKNAAQETDSQNAEQTEASN